MRLMLIFVSTLALAAGALFAEDTAMERQIVKLSNIQQMLRPNNALIITSDEEMEKLEHDPNMKVRAFGAGFEDMAKQLQGFDGALINVAYDFFFGGDKREYFPTSPQCIRTFKALHDAGRKYGVGFGASVLSPLDLGPAYYREKGRGGQTCQFREGTISPEGKFAVPMRVQQQWFHNKGPVKLYVKSVKAYAFRETRIGNSSYYAVDPAEILDVSANVRLEREKESEKTAVGYAYTNGTVVGEVGSEIAAKCNRVLAVIVYDVEEMDYFHEDGLSYSTSMLDAHKAAGITYDSFYSDEMHIQFDWDLGQHFGTTEINTRYVTPGLVKEYARRFGRRYEDFEKYLVYFAFAQHGSSNDLGEPEMSQHVFGPNPADIYATWKFRRDYFRLLTDHVVDLFIKGKRYGEKLFGRDIIWTRAHATWQESPTCDHVDAAWKPKGAPVSRYDYTPAYDWSSSIRENVSACYDYFRWGDFLTGMGNDFPEGGWIDRCYYGAAMTASFGAFNDVPYSYWGHWGAPAAVSQRVHDVAATYGVSGGMWNCGDVQGWQHRKTPVLALYPLDLNHIEERFGSWMVQYGYCDYLTEEKFAELAKVLPDGRFRVKDREYNTLLVLYEPMVMKNTMKLISQIGERGGRVIWTGPPPAIYHEDGREALRDWKLIFGIEAVQEPWNGLNAEGAVVAFTGSLEQIPPFRVPTHLLPDRVYPAIPANGTEPAGVVKIDEKTLTAATVRSMPSGGKFIYFGGRPRDDQSGSTPDAPRTLFHLLRAVGAYTEDGPGWAEIVSNTGDLLVCEMPNGAVSITHHYYNVVENWSGGFFRPKDEKFDESVLPPVRLIIKDRVFGPYRVSYEGDRVVTFRLSRNRLIGFQGVNTQGITLNGREYRFADVPVTLTFAPVPKEQLAEGIRQAWSIQAYPTKGGLEELKLTLPFEVPDGAKLVVDPKGNGRGTPVPAVYVRGKGRTELRLPQHMQGPILYLFVEDQRR